MKNMYKQDFTQKCPDYFHFSKIKLQQYDGDISILETTIQPIMKL